MIDPRIKDWATAAECVAIDAVLEHGSSRKAAKALGVNKSTINEGIARAKKRAAHHGYSPEHDMIRPVPDGFLVRGTSTYYNAEGKVTGQWVKSKLDDKKVEEAMRAAVEALMQEVPRAKISEKHVNSSENLLNLYTLTDSHVGMKAWATETGGDWDLEIAEATLCNAFAYLVGASQPASVGVVSQLGDFLHFDSLESVTPQHRNLLDSDSRFPKVVQVAVRVLRYVVDLALSRHDQVIVLMSEGNHDMASSVWLRHLFSLLYENEPRVIVHDGITPYSAIQHGNTMLAFHHGHMTKNDALPMLFAATYPQMWGGTTRRYCHTGHRHHAEEKEHNGMTVIQHQTIAARDAYAARGGWIADRSISAITYHKEFGQVGRTTCVPEMLG